MTTIIISIVAFILAIGILVAFHEFGHFFVARKLGVKVLRFSVGFGKPLWRFKDKYETEYVIAALPIGGYVKMLDEREGEVSHEQKKYAFNRKPVWARFLIVLAGPGFNFLFAIIAYWIVYMVGVEGWIPTIGKIVPSSIAAQAGMVEGEEIIGIDGVPTNTWQAVHKQVMKRLGEQSELEIETTNKETIHTYTLSLAAWELHGDKPDLLHALGIDYYQPPFPPLISEVDPNEPAAKAGVIPGDLIIAVNDLPITTWKEFSEIVQKSIQIPVHLTVMRNKENIHLTLLPRAKEAETGEMVGYVGVMAKTLKIPDEMKRKERLNPLNALISAIKKTEEYIVISFKIIGKMITGKIGLHNLSGPITIAQVAGASATVGFTYYLGFLALISVSLGVLNLLPIPILDGGHLLYYSIEMILRKPISEKVQAVGFKIGMFVLLFLMTVAFYNDVLRLL